MSVKVKELKQGKAVRYSFGKCNELLKVPALLEIQKKSYDWYKEVIETNGASILKDE